MKDVNVPIDWLNQLNGGSVADAVKFLSTLPQGHTLTYWQCSGDDQGVEITSALYYTRPFTEQELAELAVQRKAAKLAALGASLTYYEGQQAHWVKWGDAAKATSYQKDVDRIRQKIEELK